MYMRSLLVAAALCGVPFAAAEAADMSTPQAIANAPAYAPPPIPIYSWTGFYVGAHLGGAWSSANWTDPVSGLGDNPTSSGIIGGGQLGFNYQVGPWVLGLEGDFSGTSLSGSDTDIAGFTHGTSTDWTSTVTGRLGYAVNRALFYAKGGAAFANERNTVTSPLGLLSTTATSTQSGWTAGGGIEYAIDPRWSARVEYDYLAFGSQSVSGPVAGTLPGSVDMNIQRVMAGINYRF
jgi:outer membrane immunogenic protein